MSVLLLAVLTLQIAAPTEINGQFEERTYAVPGADPAVVMKYRLLKPATIEAGRKYPIVLNLHGAGERGDDNQKQLKYLPEWMVEPEYRQKYACFMVVPQTQRGWAGRRGADAPATDEPQLADGEHAVGMLKACMQEFPIDPARVYITGLSLGGYGTWATAAKYPDLFAAAAPICGGGDPKWAERLKNLPIWAVHGDADPTVNIEQSRRMVKAVNEAGGKAKLTELPGVGHNSWNAAYKQPDLVIPWLFEQRKR